LDPVLTQEQEIATKSRLTLIDEKVLNRTTYLGGVLKLIPGLLAAAVSRKLRSHCADAGQSDASPSQERGAAHDLQNASLVGAERSAAERRQQPSPLEAS
jgi:hypothetical protein